MPFPIDSVILLIALTVGLSFYGWNNHSVMERWIFSPYRVRRHHEWYRFLSSGFLHADFMHLFFNMFAFYSFGQLVQNQLMAESGTLTGILLFLLLYLGGIVVSDIPTYLRHQKDARYGSLGASGGVAAVVFAAILFYPVAPEGGGIMIFPIPFRIQPFVFGFLYLGYSYYQGRRSGDNINHDAHFYGALYGVLLTMVLYPTVVLGFWQQISNKYL
ncbi:rhomboid family intramembrane serine protease [Hymenobacter edaphi]|uniref:Rhomboid family intramembrane serine protease n=1 Tax=Hymenobacter edaphi TaxID=2211146 RepID=A0A328B7Y8_9BACT|nr:rhomboid family intramembrane serine protease [Hymenobacter edaphi]RAK63253.1 rhomboid family intramembrane serine protease [Hymenobacter edaphi]